MKRLTLLLLLIIFSKNSYSGDIDPSGYTPFAGGKFFVLTDGVFSTKEEIKVRFESAGDTAIKNYAGVDVRLYHIPKPLEFLKKQKNLHRPDIKGRFEGEGLVNVLSYLWDSWYKKTRLAWQRIFSLSARKSAVTTVPELKQAPAHTYQTRFSPENQFRPMPGLEIVDSFRYPVWEAKVAQPPADVRMEGSSSNFIQTPSGNVMLPMGKRKPGLYLVEALIGSFRATTLVFVSDSLVVTKVSSNQALVWTVDRESGLSRPKSKVVLYDGVGALAQGSTDGDGVFISKRSIPERTFAMIEDGNGGVAISENFFYDSEVFQPKIYLFTDRPLYQPGDNVSVRAFGRNVKREGNKENWFALAGTDATLSVVDAMGVSLITKKMVWKGAEGGEVQFRLPDSVESGGYSLKLRFEGEDYGAAFRVGRFSKPHFDAQILFEKPSYKVGEKVAGRVVLTYPSGQPVVGAEVDLQLRSEKMTVYEGSYGYQNSAPVELKNTSFRSNGSGEVTFSFPPAEKPSRYIVSARAFDQAAYRVTTKKELLVEGYLETYLLTADFNATDVGAPVVITFDRQGVDAGDANQKLKSWQAIRLEDRAVLSGPVSEVDKGSFTLKFQKSGHYVIRVVDAGGVTRGVRSHVVLGPDLKSAGTQVEILSDRENYEIGDTANLILTFPASAEDALLTLERNEVVSHGRLGKDSTWFKSKKIGESQWKIEVRMQEAFAPNVLFSVAYSRNGQFSFQNRGLVVKKPMIEIAFKPNKKAYLPREKVQVEIETKYKGKPIAALVSVGVVDEMIYVLQPEIAPPLGDFFHHLRRNQVRTSSSLTFYSFNPASSDIKLPNPEQAHRDLKLLQERARRDTRDTAYWNGSLKTDPNGRAKFEFTLPDALTRWRMTARAIAFEGPGLTKGSVGESKGYITSHQDYYLKWTGPTRFRLGDKPKPAILAFNSTRKVVDGEIQVKGNPYQFSQRIQLKPGANTVILEKSPDASQELESRLLVGGKSMDALVTPVDFNPVGWTHVASQALSLENGAKLEFPASARGLRLKLVPDAAYQFQRIADDLLEYPWGCVEQTSSRLIPMVMAAKAMGALNSQEPLLKDLTNQISSERRRLVSMAGPGAKFSWWGDMTGDNLFLTAHAYHADFRASKFLGIEIPKDSWEHLLKIYAEAKEPTNLDSAYALWVLSYLGQPVAEQVNALAERVALNEAPPFLKPKSEDQSFAMDAGNVERDLALLFIGIVGAKSNVKLSPAAKSRLELLLKSNWDTPVFRAAVLAYGSRIGKVPDIQKKVEEVLERVRMETPTIDRALTLALIEEALPQSMTLKKSQAVAELGENWKPVSGVVSTYQWKGKGLPPSLPKVAGAYGEVVYETDESPKSSLDFTVNRKLYLVKFGSESESKKKKETDTLEVEELKTDQPLDPRALYVDEITVDPKNSKANYVLIEAPLPSGGEADSKTWGLEFSNLKTNFVETRSSGKGTGYSIPVARLESAGSFHQLVRFSSRGEFKVPPVRVFKMYRPMEQAYESGAQRTYAVK